MSFLYKSKVIAEHAKDLEFGDIILVRYPMWSIVGWLIQVFLGATYAHSATFSTIDTVFEAKGGAGVDYAGLTNRFSGARVTILRYKGGLPKDASWDMIQKMNTVRHMPYDRMAVFYMILTNILVWIGLVAKRVFTYQNPWDDGTKFFCSQLTAYLYEDLDIIKTHWTNAVCDDFLYSDKLEVIYSDFDNPRPEKKETEDAGQTD